MQREIVVVEYDSSWRSEFEAEAKLIAAILGDIVVQIHHIGSTAIPGIYAKPIIDFLLLVRDLVELDGKSSALEALGYEAMGEYGLPGRRYFRKNNTSGVRTHQVHAYEVLNPEVTRHLAFRDYMVAHPEIAKAYGELKRKLAQKHPHDIQAYMDGKDPFIKEHEAKSIAWRLSQTGM